MLARLNVLVGRWDVVPVIGGQPLTGAWTRFEWQTDGAFLVQHADAELPEGTPPEWVANSPYPVVTIIGLDDTDEQFSMLWADARGVFRVYQMTLSEDGDWRIWRDAPGFRQRFTGTFSADRRTVQARWEKSTDGTTWETDFDLTYRKAE